MQPTGKQAACVPGREVLQACEVASMHGSNLGSSGVPPQAMLRTPSWEIRAEMPLVFKTSSIINMEHRNTACCSDALLTTMAPWCDFAGPYPSREEKQQKTDQEWALKTCHLCPRDSRAVRQGHLLLRGSPRATDESVIA